MTDEVAATHTPPRVVSPVHDNDAAIVAVDATESPQDAVEEVVIAPTGPSKLELLEEQESASREEYVDQQDGTIAVAALASQVGIEAIERAVVIAEEATEWQSIIDVAAVSLEEALLLSNLNSELKSLEDEDEKLRVIIDSQEVLLVFSKETTADIAAHQSALELELPKLEKAKELLSMTQERLRHLPSKNHAVLDKALTAAEKAISGASGDESTRPQLKEAWTAAAAQGDDDNNDAASLRYEDTFPRCTKAVEHHEELCNTIDALFRNHEAALLELEEKKSHQTEELVAAFEAERRTLEAPHKQLKQVENEQLFHIRRGTFIKERQTSVSHDELLAQRVKSRHTTLCDGKLKAEKEIDFIGNEVRDLKRTLEDLKRVMEDDRNRAASKRHDFTDEQLQASRTRTLLEQEQEDLRLLKTDLTKVLQFVKLKNKTS